MHGGSNSTTAKTNEREIYYAQEQRRRHPHDKQSSRDTNTTSHLLQLVDRHGADHRGDDVRREDAGEDDEKPAVETKAACRERGQETTKEIQEKETNPNPKRAR